MPESWGKAAPMLQRWKEWSKGRQRCCFSRDPGAHLQGLPLRGDAGGLNHPSAKSRAWVAVLVGFVLL